MRYKVKTKIILLLLASFLLLLVGCQSCPETCDDGNECTEDYCSEATRFQCIHDIVGDCKNESPAEFESENVVSCKNECFNDKCEKHTFYECVEQLNNCKKYVVQGIILEKCEVECLNSSDCASTEECVGYKCNKKATCFDGIKNQGEYGVDCGRPCQLGCSDKCINEAIEKRKKWWEYINENSEEIVDGYIHITELKNSERKKATITFKEESLLGRYYDSNSIYYKQWIKEELLVMASDFLLDLEEGGCEFIIEEYEMKYIPAGIEVTYAKEEVAESTGFDDIFYKGEVEVK